MTRKLIDAGRALGATVGAAGMVATLALRVSGRTLRWSSTLVSFTPMIVPAAALLGIDGAVRGRRRSATLFGLLTATASAIVAPRARATKRKSVATPTEGRTVRIISANLLKGRADIDALMALVHEYEPDVLALQEQNPRYLKALDAAGLFALMPHCIAAGGGRSADGALVSRHPLTAAGPELPSEFVTATMALPGGDPVPLICAHPWPPAGPRHEERWIRSMEFVPEPSGWAAGGILVGDFNATLDHPEFRRLLEAGWQDAGKVRGGGLRPTWGGYGILRLTIDHILAPPGAAVLEYDVHRLPSSDHRAIRATLQLP